jgi:flagellin FlaB
MLVGGVGIAGLAGAGWVVLGDGTLPLVGGDDERGGPEGAIRAYVDALNAGDATALRDALHDQSPLDGPEDGGLSNVQDMEFTLENATVVDEELSEDASEYESVQAFETVEFTLAVEGTEQAGGNEEFTQAFVVAQNQAGEWKLWNEPSTVTTQSEETGTESTEQVADSLDVVTEVGVVGADNTITELRIGVGRAPGSGEINLAELTLQYVSDDAFANVIVGDDRTTGERARGDTNPEDIVVGDRDPDDERYAVDVITAASTDDVLVTEDADRYELVIPLGPGPGIDLLSDGDTNGALAPLPEGNEVEITITTEVGSQTVAFVQVPDSLAGLEPGENVDL